MAIPEKRKNEHQKHIRVYKNTWHHGMSTSEVPAIPGVLYPHGVQTMNWAFSRCNGVPIKVEGIASGTAAEEK